MAEQALHAYPRANGTANRGDLRLTTGVTAHQHTLRLVGRTRDDLYLGDRGDTGQCLTTKPQGRQYAEVVDVSYFAGCEPLQREDGLLGAHAAAVIGYLDETAPAVAQFNVNAYATGIEGIIDE